MAIGWYIHHHGRGHLHRFLAVAPRLGSVTALTSLEAPAGLSSEVSWRQLPCDVPVPAGAEGSVEAGGALHWAPLGPGGYRDRMEEIAAWIAEARPDAVVVDVSVEVAALVRLLSVPVIWIAQRGRREDAPHALAFALASRIIAPWTRQIGSADVPPGAAPVIYTGALSRFDDREPAPAPAADDRRVAVLLGFGGHAVTDADIAAAARATPGWHWDVMGLEAAPAAPNVTAHGADADVWELLGTGGVVVASASSNAVAEVAAARRPLIVLPQARPFDEQLHQARALERAGLAENLERWPPAADWPGILDRARGRDVTGWAALHDGRGAERLAEAIGTLRCG